MMRSSCFNILFSTDDTYAVWNSLSDRVLVLSEREYLALLHGRAETIEMSRRQLLQQEGVLVDEPDEMGEFIDQRHADRQLRSLYFRVLTTTACNARCAYCYEQGFPVSSMDENTAVSVAQFIAQQYSEHPLGAKVTVEWFGGEPSLNPDAIQTITEWLHREEVPFQTHMTSNGILITEQLISKVSAWNLRRIQITLDAADQAYETIKQVPPGSFDQVLENIDLCLSSDIRVVVRINYAGDRNRVKNLIEKLAARYSERAVKPQMYISPIYGAQKSIPSDIMREVMELNGLLVEANLRTFEEVYSLRQRDRCFCATPWGFTIMPDGTLVNCSHNVSAQNTCGTIWNFTPVNEMHQKFLSNNLQEACYTCPLMPICGGGCPAAQYGVAQMNLCIPYRNVITDILRARLKTV